jgi:tRNA 2-thiouridine synthesizing protein A
MFAYSEKFDATGVNSRLPDLRSKQVLTAMQRRDRLCVVFGSGSSRDFDAFCRQAGHELIESFESGGKYHDYINRA